jgi:hypothetical protein
MGDLLYLPTLDLASRDILQRIKVYFAEERKLFLQEEAPGRVAK